VSIGSALVIVALLAANALFVAFEFALVAARRTRIDQLADAGLRRARLARHAMASLPEHIAAVQLGVTAASLGLGAVAEPSVAHLLRSLTGHLLPARAAEVAGFVLGLALVVLLHTVFGELVPKNLSIAAAETTLMWLAPILRVFVIVFRPVIVALDGLASLGLRLLRVDKRDELFSGGTAEEIARLLSESREHGLIEAGHHELLAGAIGFGERPVTEVMVPRAEVVAVPASITVAEAEAVFVASGRSRLPVYGRDVDDVLGFVHAKDVLAVPEADRALPLPRRSLRRMLLIGRQRSLGEVLASMQRSHLHVALVVDADARTAGLVTLEDVLEAVVGSITDETDR
jgi:CBS domain containing-hemolysin-like protein